MLFVENRIYPTCLLQWNIQTQTLQKPSIFLGNQGPDLMKEVVESRRRSSSSSLVRQNIVEIRLPGSAMSPSIHKFWSHETRFNIKIV